MYQTVRLWGLAMVLGVLAGGTVARAQTGGLTGKAILKDGSPCVKCPIIIERQEIKGVYKTKTDKHGNYVYIGLPLGQYKITLQDPNGNTLFYITHHVGMGDPTTVDFDLPKEMKEQAASPQVQQQIQEQQKEQKQFTGLKELFDKGMAAMQQKNYAEAISDFEQALPLAKGNNQAIVLGQLGEAYDKAKQYDQALATYQKVLAIAPNDANTYNQIGNVYAEMGKIPEAQQAFQKSAELNPAGASKAYFNLGAIMYNTGKMDEAAAAFKKATELDPKYADAYALLGRSLMGKLTTGADGKVIAPAGTADAWQEYLKLDPNGPYAQEAQADLQIINGSVPTEFKSTKKKKKS